MKLISFLNEGAPSYGIVNGDDVLDLTPLLGAQAPDLKSLIAQNLFAAAADMAKTHKPTLKFSQLQLLPVIPKACQYLRRATISNVGVDAFAMASGKSLS